MLSRPRVSVALTLMGALLTISLTLADATAATTPATTPAPASTPPPAPTATATATAAPTATMPAPAPTAPTAPAAPAPTAPAAPSTATSADTLAISGSATVTPLGGTGGERLSVTADSTTPLVSMTVHLSDAATGKDVLDLAMNPPPRGAQPGESTWTSAAVTPAVLPPGSYDITVDATDTGGTAVAAVSAGTLSTRAGRVRLAARLSAAKVRYGARVTVSGTVSYASGSGYAPLPGQRVAIYGTGSRPAATAVTSADGHFTAALPTVADSLDWTVRAGGGRYLTTATATLPMTVSLPAAITGFRASLNPSGQVSFHGCLGLAPRTPGSAPPLADLTIQYAAGRHGPWHTLGTVSRRRGHACRDGGRTFSGTLPAHLNRAYYRASYAGYRASHAGVTATDAIATGYLPAVSRPALAAAYADRISHLRVSRHSRPRGGVLTVSGRLQYYAGGWRGLAGQTVLIILRPKGSRTWYWIAKARTNRRGGFATTFTDPTTATWSAEYLGDKSHLAVMGATIPVRRGRSSGASGHPADPARTVDSAAQGAQVTQTVRKARVVRVVVARVVTDRRSPATPPPPGAGRMLRPRRGRPVRRGPPAGVRLRRTPARAPHRGPARAAAGYAPRWHRAKHRGGQADASARRSPHRR